MKSIGQRMRELLEVWNTGKTEQNRKWTEENRIIVHEIIKPVKWTEANKEQAEGRFNRRK